MRNFILFIFTMIAFSTFSCQEDEETITQNTADSFGKSNAIASLIKRVSQSETTIDNVLDNTSLFRVKLPVEVEVDGYYLTINDVNDYDDIQEIKELYGNDDDIVSFTHYPITIVFPNYQEVEVNTPAQLEAIKTQMASDNNYNEINCIDFQYQYPFKINIYNTNNQVANTVSITSDSQLYNFIDDLEDTEIVGIVYPIILKKTNNVQYTINSNSDLEDTIENVISECNTGSGTLEFHEVLTSGSWHVSYCYYDDDETSYYNGYNFTFTGDDNDGTSIAIYNTTYINGDWQINTENGYQRLDLHFDGDAMHDLETNWNLQELTSTMIRLKKESGGNQYYYLTFTKN